MKSYLRSLFWMAALPGLGWALLQALPLDPRQRGGIGLGLGLAAANAILSFSALAWAFRRSNKVFYGAFFGGVVWKLLVLAGAFALLWGRSAVPGSSVLIALAVTTFFLNLLEAGLLPRAEKKA